MLGDTESFASWSEFFSWLKRRGLRGVDLITSDGHDGLVRAIRQHFQGVTWQRCQTHFMRNVLEAGFEDATAVLALPEKDRKRLRTTNSVERLNAEIRRGERVIRIFPIGPRSFASWEPC